MQRAPRGAPIGEALSWAARIMAVGLVMFLPGVAGDWLDGRLGTRVIGPAGFVLGFAMGITWLVSLGRRQRTP